MRMNDSAHACMVDAIATIPSRCANIATRMLGLRLETPHPLYRQGF
jgi:hypothetical protein